jgi:hypothetical protein
MLSLCTIDGKSSGMHFQTVRPRFLFAAGIPVILIALAQTPMEVNRRMDLVLEQKKGESVQVMDPTHVFNDGNLIRFRLRSAVDGYLYVINQGSSRKIEQLFPRDELRQSRQIIMGKDYLVPASGNGWFAVKDPPGYETVYFLISPIDLGDSLPDPASQAGVSPPVQADSESPAFATATPRCDDDLFKARGECLDSGAGVKPMQKGESLPDKLPHLPASTSRDLVIVKDSKDTSISSTQPFDGPAVYRFKIAHR